MPPGRRPSGTSRRRPSGGLGSSFLSNQASDEARRISNRPRLPVSAGGQAMEDPIAFWQRTLQEQGALQNYGPGGGGGGSGGGGGRRYGGGGGGGGGGGAATPDYAAMLAAIRQPYDQATVQAQDRATGARRRIDTENAALTKQVGVQNTMANQAIAQRAAALKAILAEAQATQGRFADIARTDLAGQGMNAGAYNQVAGIEANRLAAQSQAQRTFGGDLDALIRDAAAARTGYAAQSRQDALLGVQDAESKLLQQIALQRAQEEAKLRVEAAAAGRKI